MKEFIKNLENNSKRYLWLILILDRVLSEFKTKHKGDLRWFYFSRVVANQMLTHGKSLYLMSTEKIVFESENSKWEAHHFDSPGMFANARIQADAYAALHHIFFDNVHVKEKLLVLINIWKIEINGKFY